MLILNRKPGQKLIIGDDNIQVKILNVDGNDVKVGINAPNEISIHREEVYLRIQKEKYQLKNETGFKTNVETKSKNQNQTIQERVAC